jgi:AraC-like DNA-binding protein
VRFDAARRSLAARVARGGPLDLAGLAASYGYYDQAHLTRDWRDLAGLPPARWAAAELGLLRNEDTPGQDGARLRFVQDRPAARTGRSSA